MKNAFCLFVSLSPVKLMFFFYTFIYLFNKQMWTISYVLGPISDMEFKVTGLKCIRERKMVVISLEF